MVATYNFGSVYLLRQKIFGERNINGTTLGSAL